MGEMEFYLYGLNGQLKWNGFGGCQNAGAWKARELRKHLTESNILGHFISGMDLTDTALSEWTNPLNKRQ